ncbi:Ribbon-helix-helix domain-containing protein [Fulvimarina manganoxydans]|uniref:Ribbon-helix-helix domain-containing protein n=1 Tax=Fulvimarina manganoxydans TaxID=937218 RepID=A0A1W1YJ18_9HYPH|nr:ribbon-helix-helix domain-containing protein [Fulvimarina manganoxydans]MEE2953452.1 ribbon-helix-helix domain-containing protein [Pseudomonadota bacterium]SMC35801.1 Ribbon-helix-helix domain-containing protein [Fulvimarina manganoxydans]
MTIKRSLAIRGHRTSITLEDAFWLRLTMVAEEAGRSTADYVALIDETRDPETNLSSAIRVHLLEDALARIGNTKKDAAL